MVVLWSVILTAIRVIVNNNYYFKNLQMQIQITKQTKIVTGSIGSQPIVVAYNNYQVTYSANKSIYWCGD
jgi:hypothetical protein